MELVKYRDSGMNTYTYFWIDARKRCLSPYFDSSSDAMEWLSKKSSTDGGAMVSTGVDSSDGSTVGDDRKSSK